MKEFFRIVFMLLTTCFVIVGCVEKKFDRSEIVGKWVLAKALESTDVRRRATIVFQLNDDGRFSAVNCPRDMFFSSPQERSSISLSAGRWKLGKSENGLPVVDFVFEEAVGLENRLPYGVRFFLTEKNGMPMLSYYQGDPDSDPRLDFEQKKTVE